VLEIIKKWVGLLCAVRQIRTALSRETNLRRDGQFRSLTVWQNALHSGTSKRALRSPGWRWCCPPLVDHTRYICHASARLRVDANMLGLALGYAAVCLLSRLSFAEGATQAAFGVRLAVRGYRNAISTHETISSSIEPPLLLSGANYWAHSFRLR
jgi:hypothetical protein